MSDELTMSSPPPGLQSNGNPQEEIAFHDDGVISRRDERPEIALGAAFAGGLLLAVLLRKTRS